MVGDPGRLRQVITNLIGNAIKFTEEGEVALKIQTESVLTTTVGVRFAVSDTGIGIPEEKLSVIFEAFSQADGSITRKYGGTGLGLTISSRLVKLMNGQLHAQSIPKKGSTFHFTTTFGLTPNSLQKREEDIMTTALEDIPILVVDDNATNLDVLANVVRHLKMKVSVADNGNLAIQMLEEAAEKGRPFKYLLLDAQMPGVDGFAVGEQVKQNEKLQQLIIIMLTSSGQRGDSAQNGYLGISSYLTKPVGQHELVDALLRPLGQRKIDSTIVIKNPTSHSNIEPGGRCAKILLAEDNAVNQKLAIRLLEKLGHSVTLAENGLQAVMAIEKSSYDLILMDVQMPEMGGFEATAIIRTKEKKLGKHTPIVAMTAYALLGDREKCLEAGMDEYLVKPINVQKLKAMVQQFTQEKTM